MTDNQHKESIRRLILRIFVSLFAPIALASGPAVRADDPHDVLVFASIERDELFDSSEPLLEGFDTHYAADVLYTYNSDRIRVLGEFLWSSDETELERLQAALSLGERTLLWTGRYHAVSKFWTREFHHGQFLQNSITRPRLEEWEDDKGPMPSHITGLLLEHSYMTAGQSEISIALSAGLGPKLVDNRLEAFDLLEPGSGHKGTTGLSLVFRPDALGTTQIGMTLSFSDIVVESVLNDAIVDLESVRQTTLGLFADWVRRDWRVMAFAVYFDNELEFVADSRQDSFVLGYLQAEYAPHEDWTLLGRHEIGPDQGSSAFLDLLSGFIPDRDMLGVRWDVRDNHSLSLEMAQSGRRSRGAAGIEFRELRLQWSAVFP